MSSMDLFEDGFPHSTPAGYEAGCRGSHCPGKDEHGFSCSEAHVRYAGDYSYRKLVEAGVGPAEIAKQDAVQAPVAAKVSLPERVAAQRKPKLVASKPAAAVEPRARLAEPRGVSAPRAPREAPPVKHGTPSGYQRGCRDGLACPKPEGVSCLDAYRAYQRDYAARRRANRGEALGSTKGLRRGERVEPSSVVAESGPVASVPVFDAELAWQGNPLSMVQELQGELAARDARIAELESLLSERSQSVSVQVPGSVMLRIEVVA